MRQQKHIYFIRPVGMDGPIKIGCSSTPEKRLAALAPWSPFPLEMVGSIPGDFGDERTIHRAFAHLHTHREWFLSSPELREFIKAALESNSLVAARKTLVPKGVVRKTTRVVRSQEHEAFLKLQTLVRQAERDLRSKDEHGNWSVPRDIAKIISKWSADVYRGTGFAPESNDLARVREYLNNPAAHSVAPAWRERLERDIADRKLDALSKVIVPHMAPSDQRGAA